MRPAVGLLPFQHNEREFSATRMSALGQKRTSTSSGSLAIFTAIRRAVFSGQYNGPSCAGLGTLYKGQVCGLD